MDLKKIKKIYIIFFIIIVVIPAVVLSLLFSIISKEFDFFFLGYTLFFSVLFGFVFFKPILVLIDKFSNREIITSIKGEPKDLLKKKTLPPALAGLLLDNKVEVAEIAGTIIDLAVRGYLNFNERSGKLTKTKKKPIGLLNYEKEIIAGIDEHIFPARSIRKSIYKEGIRQGFFGEMSLKTKAGVSSLITFSILSMALLGAAGIILAVITIFSVMTSVNVGKKTSKGLSWTKKYEEIKNWLETNKITQINLGTEYVEFITALKVNDKYIKKLGYLKIYGSLETYHTLLKERRFPLMRILFHRKK